VKIKVVVLDGDFNKHNQECWTSDEFKKYIVLPQDNIGSVLTGVSELSLKNGEAFLRGVALNDNSKFVRCGKFRLGVMVDDNLGERVLEGITEPFIVKDCRGEGSHESKLLINVTLRIKPAKQLIDPVWFLSYRIPKAWHSTAERLRVAPEEDCKGWCLP
jgi:hypothetical protein